MRTYLVTGSAGFIGSHVARQLLTDGDRVIGVDGLRTELYPADHKLRRQNELGRFERFESHVLDLRSTSLRPHLAGVDAVIHLAALAGIDGPGRSAAAYQQHNVDATSRVLDAMRESGVHLVHASTSSVYGASAVGDESQPLVPVSAYGESKVRAEALVNSYVSQSAGSATVLRLFSAYGPDQRPDMAYAAACRALITGLPMSITGDGTQSRSNTFVTDVAAAVVLAARARTSATLNIAGPVSVRLIDAVKIIAGELGVTPRLEFVPTRGGDQVQTRGDSTLARELLGWRPTVSIREGLAAQVAWALDRVGADGTRRHRTA